MDTKRPIGFVDSGLGGLSVLYEARKYLPLENLLYFGDSANNPYGTKSKEQILDRMFSICDRFVKQNCKAIVIACNTATAVCINELREKYDIPIISMEPAFKPAANSDIPLHIAIWATKVTLSEQRFVNLLHRFEKNHTIDKIACMDLVGFVEDGTLQDEKRVKDALLSHIEESSQRPDRIVLGCTHFYFYRRLLSELAPDIELIDGHLGTVRQLKHVLQLQNALNQTGEGSLQIDNSNPDLIDRSYFLLEFLKEVDEHGS